MTTLARWRRAQDGGEPERARRPFLSSEEEDLTKAEKWRNQVISEVARKVAQIQNAGLGEFRIRDLNDEINKLLREKGHWEIRIRELGGTDYTVGAFRMFNNDGQEVPGNRGYKYFGAAKDLPGVRELFSQEPAQPPRRTRGDLMKHVDADYYGLRDDDDGVLKPLENLEEKKAIAKMIEEYKEKCGKQIEDQEGRNGEKFSMEVGSTDEHAEVLRYIAHVPNIPTQAEMEEYLLEREKRKLLETILGDGK